MKFNSLHSFILTITFITASLVNVTQAETSDANLSNLHSSSVVRAKTKPLTKDKPDTCDVDSVYDHTLVNQSSSVKIDNSFPMSLMYLNDEVKETYDIMRNKVISHVKKEVILSLFNLNENGFAPENIAAYVSEATKPFLPFSFANGVKIIDITHKEGTIVYKAETPFHKNHSHTVLLTKAGIASATRTVCNDSALVEDLLERDIVIQYDYYDPNGVFICSFNIKDSHTKKIQTFIPLKTHNVS